MDFGGRDALNPWAVPFLLIPILLLSLLHVLPANAGKIDGQEVLGPFREMMTGFPERSGIHVLEKGEESLLARAWLADHATASIDVQYFIWSTDNIGILAAEALLRAAERGVKVRVLVDDLLLDAADDTLIALEAHPNIAIRIYNPVHKVGVSKPKRVLNLLTDFREANQRMHDKTFVVDRTFAITGGRNMADEYFDYNQKYNFRDRDALLIGPAAAEMSAGFETFWNSELSHPVGNLLKYQKSRLTAAEIGRIWDDLHRYARVPRNFSPEVRQALENLPQKFPLLLEKMVWEKVSFLHDQPGKNDGKSGLGGGGETTQRLIELLQGARQRVTIQSPYLVLTDGAKELFRELVRRGVEIRISTNSLGSTDNLIAFSGYSKQRKELLESGVRIFEFQPHPKIQTELVERYPDLAKNDPIFAIHAKTLVVDGRTAFIGTFNLDPRSVNLNTEVGVLFTNPELAAQVEDAIFRDMAPENSWEAGKNNYDGESSWTKRLRLKVWKVLPIDSIL